MNSLFLSDKKIIPVLIIEDIVEHKFEVKITLLIEKSII